MLGVSAPRQSVAFPASARTVGLDPLVTGHVPSLRANDAVSQHNRSRLRYATGCEARSAYRISLPARYRRCDFVGTQINGAVDHQRAAWPNRLLGDGDRGPPAWTTSIPLCCGCIRGLPTGWIEDRQAEVYGRQCRAG